MEVEEEEYQAARRDRLRRDRLMEIDPLQLMFESENDVARRRVLQVCPPCSKEEMNTKCPPQDCPDLISRPHIPDVPSATFRC